MTYHELHTRQVLPISLQQAWDFFSSPANLGKITPEYMRFRILSGFEEGTTREGMLIRYTVRPVLGIPMLWVTKIIKVNAPYSFTDIQLKGPYAEWHHTHSFKEVEGGVEMADDLRYRLPLGFLGRIVHSLFVRRQVESIFAYRTKRLEQLFKDSQS